ncbi:MAG: aspartate/glutamate racemase family protein [Thaumarchaeota archaeon]|nr:aspartate/glutamate racemase family protein [Nitrososphaerota archaeon]
MRLAFVFPGRDVDKKNNPSFFRSLEATIDSVKRPETSVEILTLPDSLPEETEMAYWYVHPLMFSGLVAAAKHAEEEGFDAVIVGCVGATDAEYAIKEVLDIPAVGVGESALLLAQVIGQNFSLLTYDNKIAAWIDRLVYERHLQDVCVSVRPANISLGEMMARGAIEKIYKKVLAQAKLAVSVDRAEVVVNASTGFAGLADYLRKHIDAPVVDAVEAGVKFAEMLADLKKSKNLYQSKVAAYKPSPNAAKIIKQYF